MFARLLPILSGIMLVMAIPSTASVLPAVKSDKNNVIITNGDHTLKISLANAKMELSTPFKTYHFGVSISQPGTWAVPEPAAKPKISQKMNRITATIKYPVTGDRQFIIEATAYNNLPGMSIVTRVKNLGKSRSEYYFMDWEGGFPYYCVPGDKGIEQKESNLQSEVRLGYYDWVFLPTGTGGLAVFTPGTVGRAAGNNGFAFLNALPRSQYLFTNQSEDMGFYLCGVKNASEAASLYKSVKRNKVTALNIQLQPLKEGMIDYGKPAPKWAREIKGYNLFPWLAYAPKEWTEAEIKEWFSDFFLLTHTPQDKGFTERCHKLGIRVMPYVNFMELLNTEIQLKDPQGTGYYNSWKSNIGCELVDLKDHPDWVCYDEQGQARQSVWGRDNHIPGLFNTCFHQMDLHKAAEAQVRKVMELGVDGIFIDNASAVSECFGAKFGKHQHADNESNTQMYFQLLKEVYNVVKSFGDDKVVMLNSGLNPELWNCCDFEMWESCIYGSGVTHKLSEWEDLQYEGRLSIDAVKHGKIPAMLNYFYDQPFENVRGCALYTYAIAKLYDYQWSDWFTMMTSKDEKVISHALYSTRLGNAKGAAKSIDKVFYREFDNGLVVLNPTQKAQTITIPLSKSGQINDVCFDRKLNVENGKLAIELTPDSGRVLSW